MYEGISTEKVWSVGKTPREAIEALCKARFHEMLDEDPEPLYPSATSGLDWGYRFTAGRTGFKAGGKDIPGGVILTWWK